MLIPDDDESEDDDEDDPSANRPTEPHDAPAEARRSKNARAGSDLIDSLRDSFRIIRE